MLNGLVGGFEQDFAARHAQATTISVTLTVMDQVVRLQVEDNGVGFAEDDYGRLRDTTGRMGLTGMRERVHAVGGSVVCTNTSVGACVIIEMPVRTEDSA